MKAVIYARYSSESQREKSIEGQLWECKAYAKKKDIKVVGTHLHRQGVVCENRRKTRFPKDDKG